MNRIEYILGSHSIQMDIIEFRRLLKRLPYRNRIEWERGIINYVVATDLSPTVLYTSTYKELVQSKIDNKQVEPNMIVDIKSSFCGKKVVCIYITGLIIKEERNKNGYGDCVGYDVMWNSGTMLTYETFIKIRREVFNDDSVFYRVDIHKPDGTVDYVETIKKPYFYSKLDYIEECENEPRAGWFLHMIKSGDIVLTEVEE